MTSPFDDGFEEAPDPEKAPAPGGPNDPGASASDENQADTPGYSGGGDGDPTASDRELHPIDDEALLDDQLLSATEEDLPDDKL